MNDIQVKNPVMEEALQKTKVPPQTGDIVEGSVVAISKAAVYIDLSPWGTGLIYGREFMNARDVIRKINIGDNISAKVVLAENENGYVELSLKEARQAIIWAEAEEAMKQKAVFDLPIKDANKGGLILEWQGIQGFIPASQLKSDHYPRVEDGDKDKILEELKRLIGQKLSVCILAVSPKEGKLIFTEKNQEKKDKEQGTGKYQVGDEIAGDITGIVEFGVFIKIEDGLEGLAHISELDWGLVEDPHTLFKVGDKVKAKIIEVKEGKISLSVKAMKKNPWLEALEKYKKGDIVSGVVIKFNKYGALASIEEGVAGLVHMSEFGTEEKLRATLELGKVYSFKISLFEPKEQKMTLSWGAANKKEETK